MVEYRIDKCMWKVLGRSGEVRRTIWYLYIFVNYVSTAHTSDRIGNMSVGWHGNMSGDEHGNMSVACRHAIELKKLCNPYLSILY